MMKRLLLVGIMSVGLMLGACGEKESQEQKIEKQITENVHALTPEERQLANANGKTFFEKERIDADNARGQLLLCRPSDSNANGLVTCNGVLPVKGGTYKEAKVYCGYRPELVGCSDEDTVAK